MFVLVDTTVAKKRAQAQMERTITSALGYKGVLNVGFPAGNFDRTVYSGGVEDLWAAFSPPEQEESTKRYWNGFGVFREAPALTITVEINIPLEVNTARVAGFFAQEPISGAIYLMHSGKIGGGQPGVGKSAFLAWSKSELVATADGEGNVRSGIIIGRIDDPDLAGRIWRFVQLVAAFKVAARSGELETDEFLAKVEAYDRYRKEFSGRKRGARAGGAIDYLSYHGDVVQALYDERFASKSKAEEISNTGLIDLCVRDRGRLTELYEVKTSTERQALYTAIGQLLTHGVGGPKRIIVLPAGEEIAPDFQEAFEEHDIAVRRFEVTKARKVMRVTLLPAED
ncbi:hypothetical protein [Bosea sp. ANAM02]|uniref:hypothetical protein n=1 Tax=Bosea sp. ANAM02 TaxID=2020412 RepID=UPI00140F2F98|nr:hypothetical protein [Bosea sp. ANAM02]BCB21936.1 hypothetical protein OCUBac02_48300 [Bosea sp. ANAM02]